MNDYKLEFFWKRFPQTLLGGPKLKLGYEAPFYVYLNQLLIYLTPFVLGGVFTIFAEFDIITDAYVSSYIYGGLMIIFVLSTQLFTWLMRRRSSNLAKFQKNLLAQDDEIDFVSCCGFETLEFLFPGSSWLWGVDIIFPQKLLINQKTLSDCQNITGGDIQSLSNFFSLSTPEVNAAELQTVQCRQQDGVCEPSKVHELKYGFYRQSMSKPCLFSSNFINLNLVVVAQ